MLYLCFFNILRTHKTHFSFILSWIYEKLLIYKQMKISLSLFLSLSFSIKKEYCWCRQNIENVGVCSGRFCCCFHIYVKQKAKKQNKIGEKFNRLLLLVKISDFICFPFHDVLFAKCTCIQKHTNNTVYINKKNHEFTNSYVRSCFYKNGNLGNMYYYL